MNPEELKEGSYYTFRGLSDPVKLLKCIFLRGDLLEVACTFGFKDAFGDASTFNILLCEGDEFNSYNIKETERT